MVVEIERVDLTGMDAKRFHKNNDKSLSIRIDQNSIITRMLPLEDDRALLSFRFTIAYSSLGYINIEGEMVFSNGAHRLVERWTECGQIDVVDANLIHNSAVSACLTTAFPFATSEFAATPAAQQRSGSGLIT